MLAAPVKRKAVVATSRSGKCVDNRMIDWQGKPFNQVCFLRAIVAVPAEQRRNISEFRFYVSDDVERAYRTLLSSRCTSGADVWHDEDCQLKGYGVPLVSSQGYLMNFSGPHSGVLYFARQGHRLSPLTPDASCVYNIDCGYKGAA